jgi:hypothetical protein
MKAIRATIQAVFTIQSRMHSIVHINVQGVCFAHRKAQMMNSTRPTTAMAAPTIQTQITAMHQPMTKTIPPRSSNTMERTSRSAQMENPEEDPEGGGGVVVLPGA